MKEWIFISDFDGTLTHKDFYQIVIDKYLPEKGADLEHRWHAGETTVFQFLSSVFASIDRSEEEIAADILEIPIDVDAKKFIQSVFASGGDFLILSAGTRYYIERLFHNLGMDDLPIISNPGSYQNHGILMTADRESPYYSERYGVDKAAVVAEYKKKYKTVYYAGDSEPDMRAAMLADVAFAKPGLQRLLQKHGHPFVAFDSFKELMDHLKSKGVLRP